MANNIPITLSNQKIKKLFDLYCKITKQHQKQVLLPMIYEINEEYIDKTIIEARQRYERLG